MAKKSDFTEQEWDQLRKGATGAGLLVSASDRSFFDSFKEAGSLAKHLAERTIGLERADPRARERARNGLRCEELDGGDRDRDDRGAPVGGGDARGESPGRGRRVQGLRARGGRGRRARPPAAATRPRRPRSRRSGRRSPEAVERVVVDETGGLHERVAGRRPRKTEAAPLQLLAHRLRLGRLGGDLRDRAPGVHASARRRRTTRAAPSSGTSSASVARALPITASILPRCRTIPASPSSRSTSRSPKPAIVADVPAGERASVALALAQDRRPGEARLRALQVEQLEEHLLVAHGHAPLLVVVGDVERIVLGHPAAARHQSANR